MMRIRDIMTRDPVTFSPETTLRDAMETLCTSHMSGAPVVSGHRVDGIVSMTDLLSFLIASPESDEEEQSENASDTWEEPEDSEDEDDIQSVMDEETLDEWIGNDQLVDQAEPDRKALLDQHVVEEVMTREVVSVPSTASVKSAAALMEKHGIHRVLVVDNGRLKGIVSALDIARTLTASVKTAT